MEAARKLATYADLLALPEDVRAEILAGEIITMPSPLPRHNWVVRSIGRFIGGPFDDDDGRGGPGGWWIIPDVDVQLRAHDVVRPDVAGWRRERFPEPWEIRPIEVRADWVCEVLSPSNAKHDRLKRRTSTRRAACRSTGSSIRPSGRSRPPSCATAAGSAWGHGPTETPRASAPST